jgi:polysaccharide pyruvyl transferase WcaK-like protein
VPAPRISIIGSALAGNKGAAAMLESSISTLTQRIPGVQFTLFSVYPAEDRTQNTFDNLDIVDARPRQLGVTINSLALLYRILPPLRPLLRRRSRAIAALTSSSVLLDQGGITFADGREKFLLYNVASILPALFVGTPVFKCAQAVGPFRSPVNRRAARMFLPRVHTLVTRGRISHENAVGLGLTNLFAGADYAFSLELDGTEEVATADLFDLTFFDDGDVVGLSPSVVLQKKETTEGEYLASMIDLVERIRGLGYRVLLVPHSARTGTDKTHNNDLPLCRAIWEGMSDRAGVLFLDRELTSQQLRYLIGRCDLFIASRFHAMVSSLATGIPTLVIGWSHKYEEVLEMFGLQSWAMRFSDADTATLLRRLDDLSTSRAAVARSIADALPEVKARSLQQADLIAALVAEGP